MVQDVETLPHKLLSKHHQTVLNEPGEVANIDIAKLSESLKIEERVAAVNAALSTEGLGDEVVFSIKYFEDGKMGVIESQESFDTAIKAGAKVQAILGSCNITASEGSERQTSFNECVPADDDTWQPATDTASVAKGSVVDTLLREKTHCVLIELNFQLTHKCAAPLRIAIVNGFIVVKQTHCPPPEEYSDRERRRSSR